MITQEEVKNLFTYQGGVLYWENKPLGYLLNKRVAGVLSASSGYLTTCVNATPYLNHRLIFLMFKGYFPDEIDHINGDKSDNRIENLRECTTSQNQFNAKLRKDNTSGIKGVSWDRKSKSWTARIKLNKEKIFLGCFWDKEVAAQIVRIERIRLHGEFANHG